MIAEPRKPEDALPPEFLGDHVIPTRHRLRRRRKLTTDRIINHVTILMAVIAMIMATVAILS
jgi:hypothetical protein